MNQTVEKIAPLTRERIVSAALSLAEQSSVSDLSLRKVAAQLKVTPMALYKYFGDKRELLSFVLEAFILKARVIPNSSLAWEAWVLQLGEKLYSALCSDSSWIPLLGSVRVGSGATYVTDAFVSKLSAAGFTTEQSVRAYFAVMQTVLGAVCMRASIRMDDSDTEQGEISDLVRAYLENPSIERLRVAPELDRIARSEQIDLGLPMVIAALRSELAESHE